MMISRHYIDIMQDGGLRRVHYRRAGSGPPLLMVHQSPRSSHEYESLMEQWSPYFTCIAPDTPGFGQSDPLPDGAEIGDFASAIIAFLDAMGIEKCAAYGFHSGGIILVTAVKQEPHRFSTLAIGGYAIWTAEEVALFGEKYLPQFHPSPYGEHLSWLWNRILEQTWFFPWFATDDAHRLTVAHDDPQRVDLVIREMLDAGNAYQVGYGAVLRAPRDIPPPDAEVPPCLISAYDGDPLQEHIDRLQQMPGNWVAQKVDNPVIHQQVSLDHLRRTQTPNIHQLPESNNAGFLHVKTECFDGLLHWQGSRDAKMMNLHAPGRDLSSIDNIHAVALDLPGHGLSDDWPDETPDHWPAWEAVIDAAAQQLGATQIKFPVVPIGDAEQLYPDLSPDRFGSYLNKAWQIARARQFFDPWYAASPDNAIPISEPDITPEKLAREHLAILRGKAAKAWHIALEQRS